MNKDYQVIEIIESKIESTIGEEQKAWVEKYDIFTSRTLFKKYNKVELLEEVDKIRKEIHKLIDEQEWGDVMSNEPWLIRNSSKEERRKRIKDALAISTLDAKAPLEEDMLLFQKYIDGEMELDEILKKIIEKYKEI